MNLIHVSQKINRTSILSNGLVPTRVKNEDHLKFFKRNNRIKSNKAVYTWLDSKYNEKFIRDFLYCKAWLHPRNNLSDNFYKTFNDAVDFRKITNLPFIQDDMLFDVYLIEKEDRYSNILHGQIPSDDIYNTAYNMEDYYAHDNKILYVYDEPLYVSKIIGSACYYFDNNKINIKILN